MELKEICLLLKEARERKGIPLKKAALYTKIPPSVIRKIEAGEKLESIGTFYLKGFLKIYASFLKKDELAEEINQIFSTGHKKASQKKAAPRIDKPKIRTDIKLLPEFKLSPDLKNIFSRVKINRRKTVIVLCAAAVLLLFFIPKKKHIRNKTPLPTEQDRQEEKKIVQPKKEANQETNQEIIVSVLTKEKVFIQVKADNSLIFQNILIPGRKESWQALKSLDIKINSPKSVILEINGKIIPTSRQRKPATYRITPEGFKVGK